MSGAGRSRSGPRGWCLAIALAILSCGGGGSGGTDGGGKPGANVVLPEVPAGNHEAACQQLCTLAAGEKVCTAKHSEFCVARCRASTRDLPAACTDCLLSADNAMPISGFTNDFGDSYCTVGGPPDLSACAKECDDGGGQPAPTLEALCQLYCAFYSQGPQVLACSAASSPDCLMSCRATIAARGRVCAQCLIEQTIPGLSCINDDCKCLNMFNDGTSLGCTTLCDTVPPT